MTPTWSLARGATVLREGGVRFAVLAPCIEQLSVVIDTQDRAAALVPSLSAAMYAAEAR